MQAPLQRVCTVRNNQFGHTRVSLFPLLLQHCSGRCGLVYSRTRVAEEDGDAKYNGSVSKLIVFVVCA